MKVASRPLVQDLDVIEDVFLADISNFLDGASIKLNFLAIQNEYISLEFARSTQLKLGYKSRRKFLYIGLVTNS